MTQSLSPRSRCPCTRAWPVKFEWNKKPLATILGLKNCGKSPKSSIDIPHAQTHRHVIYKYMCIYIIIYRDACYIHIHVHIQLYIHMYTLTYIYIITYIHTYIRTYVRTYVHPCIALHCIALHYITYITYTHNLHTHNLHT